MLRVRRQVDPVFRQLMRELHTGLHVLNALVYRDFELQVPYAPGLGLSLDEERLAFFRRDKTSTAIHPA